MKLANALLERADLLYRTTELSGRLSNNARVQEGEKPAEDPYELMEEYDRQTARLEELMARINLTNSVTKIDGVTLTELLAKRECLKRKLSAMRDFLTNASSLAARYSKSEIKILSTVPVSEIQKHVDVLAKELREVDETIQSLNWTTELI